MFFLCSNQLVWQIAILSRQFLIINYINPYSIIGFMIEFRIINNRFTPLFLSMLITDDKRWHQDNISENTTYAGHSSSVSWLVHSHHQAAVLPETVHLNPCVFRLYNNIFSINSTKWLNVSLQKFTRITYNCCLYINCCHFNVSGTMLF